MAKLIVNIEDGTITDLAGCVIVDIEIDADEYPDDGDILDYAIAHGAPIEGADA